MTHRCTQSINYMIKYIHIHPLSQHLGHIHRTSLNKCAGQKTNPHPCLITMKFAGSTPHYANFKCWKYDSDPLSSFWDIASQSQKLGCIYSSRHIYSAKYGILIIIYAQIIHRRTLIGTTCTYMHTYNSNGMLISTQAINIIVHTSVS